MSRSADKLAFALSSAERVSRQQYKKFFDYLFVTDAVRAGHALDESIDHLRRETAWQLEALGICDFPVLDTYAYACRPHLYLLPPTGLPAAVLAGGRSPELLNRLRTAARANRQTITMSMDRQTAFALLPQRVRVVAESLDALRSFAATVELALTDAPATALLLAHCASASEYAAGLRWEPHFDPDWDRTDFDTQRMHFSARCVEGPRRLSKYSHPEHTYRVEDRLIDNDQSAIVERSWGRLVALSWAGVNPYVYDADHAELLLPVTVPLPRLYARALVACSGFAPVMRELETGGKFRVYSDVPPGVVSLLEEKLNPPRM